MAHLLRNSGRRRNAIARKRIIPVHATRERQFPNVKFPEAGL
jgi:hypothetical protein